MLARLTSVPQSRLAGCSTATVEAAELTFARKHTRFLSFSCIVRTLARAHKLGQLRLSYRRQHAVGGRRRSSKSERARARAATRQHCLARSHSMPIEAPAEASFILKKKAWLPHKHLTPGYPSGPENIRTPALVTGGLATRPHCKTFSMLSGWLLG